MFPLLASLFPRPALPPEPVVEPFVVHEWGTFTAVAGPDGKAVSWRPLLGPSDLPAFVYTFADPDLGWEASVDTSGAGGKYMPALIRMETPVLYFYGPDSLEVEARVDFPSGTITEWYPRARHWTGNSIQWGRFRLSDARPPLIEDRSDSHYYPARDVAADTVTVCDPRGDEQERFLFYRGVGDFELSLRVSLEDSGLTLAGAPRAVVFERRGEQLGYAVVTEGHTARPTLDDSLPALLTDLEELLVEEGLYADEAHAMVETWRDHWFEEGLRVLYPLPRAETDTLLPLSVDPVPDRVERVMMGRIEVLTPEAQAQVSEVLDANLSDSAVEEALTTQHGRFVEPLLRRSAHPRADRILSGITAVTR